MGKDATIRNRMRKLSGADLVMGVAIAAPDIRMAVAGRGIHAADTGRGIRMGVAALLVFFSLVLIAPLRGSAAEAESEPSHFWGEIYWASVATDAEDGNVTTDPFLRWGIHLFRIFDRPVDLYAKARFYHDTEANYWNNKWQLGLGARWFPFEDFGMLLFLEYLYGDYTGRERAKDPSPNDAGRFNAEGGAAYWGWFGPAPWAAKGVSFYPPLAGWREIYGDAIYYERDSDNLIGTIDIKEGLMLARAGDVVLDAYLTLEAGADANQDPWNHYVKAGPGFRITPFADLDMKISFEYFLGRYTRGAYGEVDRNIADFEVTASFWMGW